MNFNKEKNYIFFKPYENSGTIGVVGYSNFINHNQINYIKIENNDDILNNNFIKNLFKNNKFNLNYLIENLDLFNKINKVDPSFKNGLKIHSGKYYIILVDIDFQEFFDENFEKVYVYRDPLISFMCAKHFNENFDENEFIEKLEYFKKFKNENPDLTYINYDDILKEKFGRLYSDYNKPEINLENYNYCSKIIKNLNIKILKFNEIKY